MNSAPIPAPHLTGKHALFLDFDGTLAPIQDDPETVGLPVNGAEMLRTLSEHLGGALVVISGRDVRDLSLRVPEDLWRAGGHGLEVCQPGEAPTETAPEGPAKLRDEIARAVAAHSGTRLEVKGAVFAVHYRAAPEHGDSLGARLDEIAQATADYGFQSGKMVFELKPSSANKGKALRRLMGEPPFVGRTPVMVGDDTTDEDAMAVAQALGGFGIKVGEGKSIANHRLANPQDVFAWIGEMMR